MSALGKVTRRTISHFNAIEHCADAAPTASVSGSSPLRQADKRPKRRPRISHTSKPTFQLRQQTLLTPANEKAKRHCRSAFNAILIAL